MVDIFVHTEALAWKFPTLSQNRGESRSAGDMGQEGTHQKRKGAKVTILKGSSVEWKSTPRPFPHHYMLCDPGIYSIQVAAGGQLLESCGGGGGLPEETYSVTITMPLFDRCENQVLKRLKDLPNVTKVWCCHWKTEPVDTPQHCPPPHHTAISFWC